MTKHLAFPLFCLLVGGVTGYGLRSMSASGGHETADSAETTQQGTSRTNSGSDVSVRAPNSALSKASLAAQMTELLVDFDVKSAQKAASKLTVEELQAALALVAAMPKSADRNVLRAQLYRAWAVIDPAAAWQAALADPLEDERGGLVGAVAGEVAKTKPTEAIKLVMSLGMGGRRSGAISAVFGEWSKVDVAAAISYSAAHPELPIESYAFGRGLTELAGKDPLKAANLAITLRDENGRNYALSGLMTAWVERDPTAAFEWAQAISNPSLREGAIASAVGAWAKQDPAAALAYVQSIPDGAVRATSFKKAWSDWFRSSPQEATAHLASITDETLAQGVGFYFSTYSEGCTPQERAALLSLLPDGKVKDDAFRAMTGSQIRKGQYNQALELLNAMPESTSRDRQVTELGQEWAKSDLTAAADWLKIQPDSSDRDLAVAGYAGTLARSDPAAAIEWANTIPDQKLRDGALKNVAVRWLRSDPAAAEAWMAQLKLSSSDQRMIQTMARMNTDMANFPMHVGQRR